MIITLPYPPKELMPNRANGKHWAQTSKAKADAKQTAYYLTVIAHGADILWLGDTVPLTITFVQSDKRHRDLDGLLSASKHFLDGVAMALHIDDKQFNPINIKRDYNKSASATIIEII